MITKYYLTSIDNLGQRQVYRAITDRNFVWEPIDGDDSEPTPFDTRDEALAFADDLTISRSVSGVWTNPVVSVLSVRA